VNRKKEALRQRSSARRWRTPIAVALWTLFAAGLLVQFAAPRLRIENNAFVMPPIVNVQGATLRPDALVRRERWMQGISGVLTVGGALALGVCYRRTLAIALMASKSEVSGR
jgi:hypothetical protein